MKKLLFILLGAFTFSCSSNTTDENREDNTMQKDVEIGSGEEINPQLELDGDSAENFEVDTISAATGTNQ